MYTEEFAAVALSRVSGIGPVVYRQLLRHFGSAEGALTAVARELSVVPGVSRELASRIGAAAPKREAEAILEFSVRHGVHILRAGSERYPATLRNFERAPAILYHRGNTDLSRRRTLAVVGTRRVSRTAGQQIERLLDPLAEYDPLIVSGLAYGIDTAAHRRALARGLPTLAVLGSGLQYVYPYANRKLAEDICRQGGGVLTEYPPWVKPEREHFPARNRIVAMMGEMTLVVESDVSGGSIITANMAHELGRKVGACPGRGGDRSTAGCNALIKQGKAFLIDGPEDIVRLLAWKPAAEGRKQLQLFLSLLPEERQVVDLLQEEASGSRIDELSTKLQWPPAKLASRLLSLEMQGIISALPGQRYRLSASGSFPGLP
ncbi:DNA processing protein [Neolewinella xylanilytica]|uniref:DNA processing protein n=1 Tax=Neolewinella xylanilytica TaxID=1514080 RepID=A0A2S6I7U3_9BACT|nr:DNA-processing protein DprA [Neolewinella xylanilytica]PPK87573.1 DNA processing protein [Neolewinella xylanilytica]